LTPVASFAQPLQIVERVTAPTAVEELALPVSVLLRQSTGVQRVSIFFRPFGTTEYQQWEMLLSGRSATVRLPADVVRAPYIEYYIRVEFTEQGVETHPLVNPGENPLKILVGRADPKDDEVRILSPEAGETVAAKDFVIAISLFYLPESMNGGTVRVFLDGGDITPGMVRSGDLLVHSPQNFTIPLGLGTHQLRVELFDSSGAAYHTLRRSFNLSTVSAMEADQARFKSTMSGSFEARSEDVIALQTTYVRADLTAIGSYGQARFGGNLLLDNQDTPARQPQNRFLLYGETDVLRLYVGDWYPPFPTTIVSGQRVRGISGNLALGTFSLDISWGQTVRGVEG
jgi:hypothetical protein